jgi:CubicO group peptidase (beta-lactamase class C family)
MQHYAVPGLTIAVVDSYEVAWTGVWGVLEAGKEAPITSETLFEAASTTKVATATAVLRLVDEGLLLFDQDVNDVLSDWRVPETPLTETGRVTVRGLLSHTAGVSRPDGGFDVAEGAMPTLIDVLQGRAPAINAALSIDHVPGSTHQYSNFGFILLQKVIEDASGKRFADVMQSMVFGPLRMSHSTFEPNLPSWMGTKTPTHHDSEGRPLPSDVHPAALAHGQLWTTASDLAVLTSALMAAAEGIEERPLRTSTARLALTPVREIEPGPHAGLRAQGLGVFLLATTDGVAFCHPGFNSPGATCFLIGFPAVGKGAVVMSNGANGLDLSFEVLSSLARRYSWPTTEGGPPN